MYVTNGHNLTDNSTLNTMNTSDIEILADDNNNNDLSSINSNTSDKMLSPISADNDNGIKIMGDQEESTISSSDNLSLSDDEEMKLLRLLDLKESLIIKRKKLRECVIDLKSQLNNCIHDIELKNNANGDKLHEYHSEAGIFQTDLMDNRGINEKTQNILSNNPNKISVTNGANTKNQSTHIANVENEIITPMSDLKIELQDKYDALPLLNKHLRLQYLRQLYPMLQITNIKHNTGDHRDSWCYEVSMTIKENDFCFFIIYDNNQFKIESPPNANDKIFETELNNLYKEAFSTGNIPRLVNGLYLYVKFLDIRQYFKDALRFEWFSRYYEKFKITDFDIENQKEHKKNELLIQLENMKTNKENNNTYYIVVLLYWNIYYCGNDKCVKNSIKTKVLKCIVTNNSHEVVVVPECQEALDELLRYYGLEEGIKNFIKLNLE
ncbi:Ctf19p SCDLUD_000685 [Saccharomycodes ludwigii]|uniref:Ctf19p n=1 Tax=Saccharomycodes ludwigii TaxID=36035 RepID=UPI001E88C459|nr:hypothetical protein SCDLUD_000685 [Saccharomycodes ludwigii]KAH3903074.1 hypothetical protein SCDLUD_000685 [Saccharomycodes ludwigii]